MSDNGRKFLCAEINAKPLRTVVDAIMIMNDEAKFHISPEGIKSKQVDEAHVGLVNVEMKKKLFDSYKASDFELGIDLNKLDNVLKLARSDDVVKLDMDDKKSKCLWISFGFLKRRIGCLDTAGMPDPKTPNVATNIKATLKKCDFELSLKATAQIADYFKMIAQQDFLNIETEGDTDKVDLKLENGNGGPLVNLSVDKKTEAMYTTDYVRNCIKPATGDMDLNISFGQDKPIKIEYNMEDKKILFEYMVAPRIESE